MNGTTHTTHRAAEPTHSGPSAGNPVDTPVAGPARIGQISTRFNTPAMWIATLCVAIVMLAAFNVAGPAGARAATVAELTPGQLWTLDRSGGDVVPLCQSPGALYTAQKAIADRNGPALGVLSIAGRATLIPEGDRAAVDAVIGDAVRIRIAEGPHKGAVGYVSPAWLRR